MSDNGIAVHCRPEVLTLQELARHRLPSPRFPSDLYKEFFSFERRYEEVVQALETDGFLRRRPDGTYRIWDAYRIMAGIMRHCRIVIPLWRPDGDAAAGSFFDANAGWVPHFHFALPDDEAWWEAAEAVNRALDVLREAQWLQQVRDDETGSLRNETGEEFRSRVGPLKVAIDSEIEALAASLPEQDEYWKNRLREHASLVIELRRAHFNSLARLCSRQLSAATRLAGVRLQRPRWAIRALVGTVNSDLRAPALTAASFLVAQKTFDSALDSIDEALPDFNRVVSAPLKLSHDDAESFLEYLDSCGLEHWYAELTVVTWDSEQFYDSTYDQRIGRSYARVRTLCALLEEALLSLAEQVPDARFRNEIEAKATLGPRLRAFARGPDGCPSMVDLEAIDRLGKNRLSPPFSGKQLGERLTALGMPAGKSPPSDELTSEKLLAGWVFVRNLTSHRFPVHSGGERAGWFETWSDHLPAINRTVLWAALALWGLTKSFSAPSG